MARSKSTNSIKAKKQKKPSGPRVTKRGNKVVGPSFEGYETWSGQAYHVNRTIARDFFYENYKLTDLLPDVWAWMKEHKYNLADIKAAKAQCVGIVVAINCKLLRQGMPDYNPAHAEYWEALPGTGDRVEPVSDWLHRKLSIAIEKGKVLLEHPENDPQSQEISAIKPQHLNIQELMRERADDAAADIEAIYDEFIQAGCPKDFDTHKPIQAILNERKIFPQHISIIVKPFERIKAEYIELQGDKPNPQLVEGYSSFSKTQVKNIIKTLDQIISDLNAYVSIKKAAKTATTRVRKPVPVEKIVSRMKFQKTYKDDNFKIELTSVSPTKLCGATEAYLYDTAKRKLIYLVADDYSQVLTVKGTTIIGFDVKKSQSKIIRKPGEQINQLMNIGRPASRKFIEDIRAVGTVPNGRTNENMIILKAW